MIRKYIFLAISFAVMVFLFLIGFTGCWETKSTPDEEVSGYFLLLENKDLQDLGEKLFFDKRLSEPEGQSCATCHGSAMGWTGPDSEINKTSGVYPGAVPTRFSNRKPISASYATQSPVLHSVIEDGEVVFKGGNFWDGRASGCILGNPAADQAQGPFLNPVEQNMPNAEAVVEKVCNSDYISLLKKVGKEIWGFDDICENTDTDFLYGVIGIAIAAFEHSPKVNQFTSKFDYYLQGKVKLTELEKKGLELFEGKGDCSACHISESEFPGVPPLFTDYTYDNLGFPKNLQSPWYKMDKEFNPDGDAWVDEGLGAYLRTVPQYAMYADENIGKYRVPTLRNVDKRPDPGFVKAYGHNGYFKSLEDVVHFYNTRDVLPRCENIQNPQPGINCWPEPEISDNLNFDELGDLGLTPDEEMALVEFMKTLSDGYVIE